MSMKWRKEAIPDRTSTTKGSPKTTEPIGTCLKKKINFWWSPDLRCVSRGNSAQAQVNARRSGEKLMKNIYNQDHLHRGRPPEKYAWNSENVLFSISCREACG